MSREIKFRAWDKKNKKWFDGYEIDSRYGGSIFFIYGFYINAIEKENGTLEDSYDCENVELCQFTGLKDKNGREIFVGDIILRRESMNSYEEIVENLQSFFEFRGVNEIERQEFYDDLEIIGNIYENPQLLKGGV